MLRGKIWETVVTRFRTVRNSITLTKHPVFTRRGRPIILFPRLAESFARCMIYMRKVVCLKGRRQPFREVTFWGGFRYIILVANVNDVFLEKFETSITLCKHIFTVFRFNSIFSLRIVNNRRQDGTEVSLYL